MKVMCRFLTFTLTAGLTAMLVKDVPFYFFPFVGALLMVCVMIGWGME